MEVVIRKSEWRFELKFENVIKQVIPWGNV
jgi:hypothetical protein